MFLPLSWLLKPLKNPVRRPTFPIRTKFCENQYRSPHGKTRPEVATVAPHRGPRRAEPKGRIGAQTSDCNEANFIRSMECRVSTAAGLVHTNFARRLIASLRSIGSIVHRTNVSVLKVSLHVTHNAYPAHAHFQAHVPAFTLVSSIVASPTHF
jgi:hypothetical protein